ncbi:MAG TPA: 50S ribosomal protein L18 [Candidatus Megaira endosymbiont of Hartmannula sinica]|nr:50S ribosomal protein L18 [Candidatus Megaera endosymbiont of Hartmannula sinica]
MINKNKKLKKRSSRVKLSIKSKSDRKRLSVFKSSKHIYAQIIDDKTGCTLVSSSTLDKTIRKSNTSLCNKESAKQVGKSISQKAKKANIKEVVFDKGGYKYHGVVKALADAARENLSF